jgi:hypothetical protein
MLVSPHKYPELPKVIEDAVVVKTLEFCDIPQALVPSFVREKLRTDPELLGALTDA